MSDQNSSFPFTAFGQEEGLDYAAIFGGGDSEPEPVAESEPAAEPEPEQLSAAPAPEEKITTEPTRKQAIPPAEEPNLMPEC